ncbi:ABC transporter ATP-binding protein [bacterium]|nr:ABC transporter ATP-binding protein [bacterium]MBP9806708.1 ABC transporter ATP-binding protein [bacterium]
MEDLKQNSSNSSGAVLVADRVSKRFDGAASNALNDISLNVAAGEFYSFLGPSGCGKTTLLRIFAGFEEPSSGTIFIDGKQTIGVPPYRRPVNMVFQSYALFPHMSVLENVAFGLRSAKRYSNNEIGEKSREALKIVRLSEFADRLPAQLSGGQQQRVALARALVMRPVVLLLDEPLSALDVRIREEMQEELSRLKRELNLTFVMVTHDQAEALAISTRVAVFNGGNLEQVGTPSEIYEQPQTAFTAGFIGRSNLLAGKVVSSDSQSIVLDCDSGLVISSRTAGSEQLPVGGSAFACFKPETVKLSSEQPESRQNLIFCQITNSSYLGSLVDLKLSCATSGVQLRAVVSSSQLNCLSAEQLAGAPLYLSFEPQAVSVIPL